MSANNNSFLSRMTPPRNLKKNANSPSSSPSITGCTQKPRQRQSAKLTSGPPVPLLQAVSSQFNNSNSVKSLKEIREKNFFSRSSLALPSSFSKNRKAAFEAKSVVNKDYIINQLKKKSTAIVPVPSTSKVMHQPKAQQQQRNQFPTVALYDRLPNWEISGLVQIAMIYAPPPPTPPPTTRNKKIRNSSNNSNDLSKSKCSSSNFVNKQTKKGLA